MKIRLLSIAFTLALALPLMAQVDGFDLAQMSDEDIVGTSRYMGLGGAMAALGGDASAVKDNPAALGVFRRSEVSASLLTGAYTTTDGKAMLLELPSVSAVIHINKGRKSGVLAHNLMFGLARQRSFNSKYAVSAEGVNSSQTDVMAILAGGPEGHTRYELENSPGIAALAYAGYDGHLIDTVPGQGGKQWGSVEGGNVNAALSVQESGNVNDYSFGWGMNIENRLYVGVGIFARTLTYNKIASYGEAFESGDRYTVSSNLAVSGLGVGVNAGVIWRPVESLRVALAMQTPTRTSFRFETEGSISSTVANRDTSGYYSYEATAVTMNMPFRLVTGASWQFGQKGLFSFEYDYSHRKFAGMRDQHMLKMGAEWAATNKFFLDCGYAAKLYGRYIETNTRILDWESSRLDSDQRELGTRHYASAGFSYRSNWCVIGLAYQYSLQQMKVWGHELQKQEMGVVSNQQHRVVLTLALRYGL